MNEIVFLKGFLLALGLIVAVGPKDAFVIKNSLKGRYLPTLFAICFLSDVVLIVFGIYGFALISSQLPWFSNFAIIGGVVFMLWHGVMALRASLVGEVDISLDGTEYALTRTKLIHATLAISLLNPLSILDSALLVGSVSTTIEAQDKWLFALGCMAASFLWFAVLIGLARLVAPLFRQPLMWRILDVVIALIMFGMSYQVLLHLN